MALLDDAVEVIEASIAALRLPRSSDGLVDAALTCQIVANDLALLHDYLVDQQRWDLTRRRQIRAVHTEEIRHEIARGEHDD